MSRNSNVIAVQAIIERLMASIKRKRVYLIAVTYGGHPAHLDVYLEEKLPQRIIENLEMSTGEEDWFDVLYNGCLTEEDSDAADKAFKAAHLFDLLKVATIPTAYELALVRSYVYSNH